MDLYAVFIEKILFLNIKPLSHTIIPKVKITKILSFVLAQNYNHFIMKRVLE